MKKLILPIVLLILSCNTIAIPVEVMADSVQTTVKNIKDELHQEMEKLHWAQELVQLTAQVKALTDPSTWQAATSGDALQTLSVTMSAIQNVSYQGSNIANKFAKLFPGVIGEQSLKNVASYSAISNATLGSASAVIQGLSQLNAINKLNMSMSDKVLRLGEAGLSQAQIAMAGAQIAVEQYNALQNLQQVNMMQTQLIAQQAATVAQKDSDEQIQVDKMKTLSNFKAN